MNRAARRRAAAGERHRAAGDSDRLRLLQNHTRQIEEYYEKAKGEGEGDMTVVFVLDLRDRAAREVAKLDSRWGGEPSDGLERLLVDSAAHGEIPTACLALRRSLAVQMLRHFAPGSARQIETKAPPPGYCWVCVVASGGTLAAQYRGGAGGGRVVSYAHC